MKLEGLSVSWQGINAARAAEKPASLAKQLNTMLIKPQDKAASAAENPESLAKQLNAMLPKPQAKAGKTAGGSDAKAQEAAQRRKQYERELRACRTKEEVEAVRRRWLQMTLSEMGAINSSNLSTAAKQAALEEARMRSDEREEIYLEFQKSARFQILPDEEDKKKQKQVVVQETALEAQSQGADMEAAQEKAMAPLVMALRRDKGMVDAPARENAPQENEPPHELQPRESAIDDYA
ncbi:MAG: hypothetical protein FWH15_05025 [Betaproteobacteria bacterium]|nr:hypothetical protein [Betaproteobacteria bacterium]